MNYRHTIFAISIIFSTSLYPAATPPRSCDGANASAADTKSRAAAQASSAALDVRVRATSRRSQGKEETDLKSGAVTKPMADDIWFDAEIDTAGPRSRLIDPAEDRAVEIRSVLDPVLVDDCIEEAVEYDYGDVRQQAREVARPLNSRVDILIALAQPYLDKDHNLFALDLFKQWKALCEEKGFLHDHGGVQVFTGKNIDVAQVARERGKDIPAIGWCCLGIAASYSKRHGVESLGQSIHHLAMWAVGPNSKKVSELRRFMELYACLDYGSLENFHKLRQESPVEIRALYSMVKDTTPLLPPLAALVAEYYYSSITVATVLKDSPGSWLAGRMISNLWGLSGVAGDSCNLDSNLISRIGSRDLPQNKFRQLSMHDNPLRQIAPNAFKYQTRLTSLSLIGCRLTVISPDMFAGLTSLEHLWLTRNRISRIKRGSFSQLRSLWRLYLSNNRLEHVPDELFDLPPRMTTLTLDNNPLERDLNENARKNQLVDSLRRD